MDSPYMEPHAVSVAISFDYALPIDQQIPLIADAGFTHFSLGADVAHSDYLSAGGQQRLRACAQTLGLAIDTIHGPRADQPHALATLTAVIDAAAELSVPVVVVHGSPFDFPEAELSARLRSCWRPVSSLRPCWRDPVYVWRWRTCCQGQPPSSSARRSSV